MSNLGRASPSTPASASKRPDSVYSVSNLSSTSPALTEGNLAETRKRQSRRDEAIRKKIESELSRKRPTTKRQQQQQQQQQRTAPRPKQGTVSALRPLPALTVPHNISVADASQLCAAKRTDCVLVVDEEEHLCGIFTAKDLAFRVVGDGLDPRTTPVSAIMTPNPMVTRDTTSATDALQTMVTRGFRHLPVCNEDGDVVGLLDITKVFHESLEKLERAYGSSQKLYNALEGVQSEWGAPGSTQSNPGQAGLMAYVEALREKMSFPDLGSILDARTAPATVGVKTTVREAAKLMRERRTTAVCVMENDGKKIAGIFTSKDVVLRVIAAGLDAKTCSVVRVMTPHPDVGLPTLSIQDALRKMHDGHYLNLPVVDDTGSLVGIVDVLKLTYATLEQVNSIGADNGTDSTGGPLFARFFGALGGAEENDSESIFSGGDASELASTLPPTTTATTPGSEVFPNDSASVMDDSELNPSNRSKMGGSALGTGTKGIVPPASVDDGTYLFKFVAPGLGGGTTHRFQARYDSFDFIIEIIRGKLSGDPFFFSSSSTPSSTTAPTPTPSPTTTTTATMKQEEGTSKLDARDFQICYHDDDGDLITMTADEDIKDAVAVARKQGKDRVVIILRGGESWEKEIERREVIATAKRLPPPVTTPVLKYVVEEEKEEIEVGGKGKGRRARELEREADQLIFGFLARDQLLPASVALLAVAIVGVFTVSKVTTRT